MEFKHFSHNHCLVLHQVPQGSDIRCSGCKFPGAGNIYACWQCNYFLHEECFRAARSFKHPSHPLHPLTLVPFPTYPSGSFFCNSCSHAGEGFSYSCSACEFDIHVHCAHLTNNANQHVSPSPVPAQDFHSQSLNPIYPPPIQTSAYPPHNPTLIPNDVQSYPPHNPTLIPNEIQSYPPHNPTLIPNETQSYPPQVPQNTSYPPLPNSPFPNPTQNYPISQNGPHMHQNTAYPHNPPPPPPPPLPQANPAVSTYSTVMNSTAATPPPLPQPNQTYPTYGTAGNTNTTANPPPPSVSQPTTPVQSDNVPPSKPPSIIKHFSHPHVLKSMAIEKQNAKICSACECELSGSAYCCTEPHCKFNLHKSCFDSPIEIKHKSHLQHPLKLLAAPPYEDGFTCNACLKDGKAFTYTCSTCSYDLHIDCVQWPDSVNRPDHKHTLTLYYSSPAAEAGQEVTFFCDVCNNPVHEMAWVYYCRECDFGTHLECVASGIKQQTSGGKSEEELMRETELKFAVLQLLIEAQGRKNMLDNV